MVEMSEGGRNIEEGKGKGKGKIVEMDEGEENEKEMSKEGSSKRNDKTPLIGSKKGKGSESEANESTEKTGSIWKRSKRQTHRREAIDCEEGKAESNWNSENEEEEEEEEEVFE